MLPLSRWNKGLRHARLHMRPEVCGPACIGVHVSFALPRPQRLLCGELRKYGCDEMQCLWSLPLTQRVLCGEMRGHLSEGANGVSLLFWTCFLLYARSTHTSGNKKNVPMNTVKLDFFLFEFFYFFLLPDVFLQRRTKIKWNLLVMNGQSCRC